MENQDFLTKKQDQLTQLKAIKNALELQKPIDEFSNDYPKLIQSLQKNDDPLSMISELIQYTETWINDYYHSKDNHNERKFSADKNLGMKLAQKYLYPHIPTSKKPKLKDLQKANTLLKKKVNKPLEYKTN